MHTHAMDRAMVPCVCCSFPTVSVIHRSFTWTREFIGIRIGRTCSSNYELQEESSCLQWHGSFCQVSCAARRICLVRAWNSGFFANAMALWLLTCMWVGLVSSIGVARYRLIFSSDKISCSQRASCVARLMAMYSALVGFVLSERTVKKIARGIWM